MSDMQIQQVLAQMRALAERAGSAGPAAPRGEGAEASGATGADFGRLLQQSLEQVNDAQQQADHMTTRFIQGAPDASLPEVMVSVQKASLEFEAVTQVRNRLVAAYQEIMNMSV